MVEAVSFEYLKSLVELTLNKSYQGTTYYLKCLGYERDDIVQEVLLKLFRFPCNPELSKPSYYVGMTVRTVILDLCRKRSKYQKHILVSLDQELEEGNLKETTTIAHHLDYDSMVDEIEARLKQAGDKALPSLLMFDFCLDGWSKESVGHILGLSDGAIRKLAENINNEITNVVYA